MINMLKLIDDHAPEVASSFILKEMNSDIFSCFIDW